MLVIYIHICVYVCMHTPQGYIQAIYFLMQCLSLNIEYYDLKTCRGKLANER